MDQYIKDLSYVIQNGDMENTYKMVWIRSIVETCCLDPNTREIHFDTLSNTLSNGDIFLGICLLKVIPLE